MVDHSESSGFTLIELSLVLVIIGLIVGGVLVGQDLVTAAGVRAQITQIEKFNTAANTFLGKYGYLPGDINAAAANKFGFAPRGTYPGQGDGNGVLEANFTGTGTYTSGFVINNYPLCGEQGIFWVDLGQANLIESTINPSAYTNNAWWSCVALPTPSNTSIAQYIPKAKIDNTYIEVFSGGWGAAITGGDKQNYFVMSGNPTGAGVGALTGSVSLTVKQAYDIDTKIDDGLPQSGRVIANYIGKPNPIWSTGQPQVIAQPPHGLDDPSGGPVTNAATATGDSASNTTCMI